VTVEDLRTIIFTGVSGGGKTTALRAVEDLGFFCVDNLPLPLLDDFIQTMKDEPTVDYAALVMDARVLNYLEGYARAFEELNRGGHVLEVVYLDASDEVLIRRFSQTRRKHPMGDDLNLCLAEERKLLAPLRAHASTCIDTSEMTPHQLKEVIQERYEEHGSQLMVSVLSFGFRYGLPSQADMVLDVRFLENPYFVERLRPLSGLDGAVAKFVLDTGDAQEFVARAMEMMTFLLPRFEAEGKVYLTVAIGCTGGKHRSVAVAEELTARLRERRPVKVRHRDLER
jgi:UPF0042 nucleotide-binding protein